MRAPTSPAFRVVTLQLAVPLYAAFVLALGWFAISENGATAGNLALLAVGAGGLASFAWGAWRWAGERAWLARALGCCVLAPGVLFGIQFLLLGAPLAVLAFLTLLPGPRERPLNR